MAIQVNNAGQLIIKPTVECTAEDYSSLMATNLESCFHLSQLAHPLLRNTAAVSSSLFRDSSTRIFFSYFYFFSEQSYRPGKSV
jgi:Tropinone reductase 1